MNYSVLDFRKFRPVDLHSLLSSLVAFHSRFDHSEHFGRDQHSKFEADRTVLVYISVVVALAVLVVSGLITVWGKRYSPDLALRQQSAALMEGRLGLANSVAAVEHDQVWDNGNVQQVWGLGTPAWRVPFEAAARLISFDRSGPGEDSGGVCCVYDGGRIAQRGVAVPVVAGGMEGRTVSHSELSSR